MKTLCLLSERIGFLILILCSCSLIGCSSDDDRSEDRNAITGIWKDGSDYNLWVFHEEGTFDIYDVFEDVMNGMLNIKSIALNGTYHYNGKEKLMRVTLMGESSTVEILSMDSKEMTWKVKDVITHFTRIDDRASGVAPDNLVGKTLAIGVFWEFNLIFKSNSLFTVKLINEDSDLQINGSPTYTYDKVDNSTATLTYSYGTLWPSKFITFEDHYTATLTLHFTTPDMGYLTGSKVHTSITSEGGNKHESSETFSADGIPFVLR